MIMNQRVEKYKNEHVFKLYLDHPDEIKRDYTNEKAIKDDYEGREILELLQNAVDQVEIGGKISLVLEGDMLTVANSGNPFSFEGVKSIMKPNLSPKEVKKDMIGQKGLGFRALLNWSKDIRIYSDDLSIRFSEQYRKSFFESAKIYQNTALLVAPEIIENIDKEDFDTIIKIRINSKEKIDEVKRQLRAINKYTLLFLNKINELNVELDNQVTHFKRESDKDVVIVSKNDEESIFNTYSKKGIIYGKKYEIVLAYDPQINPKENKLYSFFETDINFPIKWKCHATLDLGTNRGFIKKNYENLELLKVLASFICEKANDLPDDIKNPYYPFDSLIKANDFPSSLIINDIDFNDIYQKNFEKAKVLPTMYSGRVSLANAPIFYQEIPFFFKHINKENILLESKNNLRDNILNKYCVKFDDETLMRIINQYSSKWSPTENVKVFLWWEKEFHASKHLPNLLKSLEGEFIKIDTIIYFLRGRDLDVPEWSKIIQLDVEYEEELKKQILNYEQITKEIESQSTPIIERIIAQYSGRKSYWNILPHVTFRDADVSTILSPINASIGNDYNKAISFLNWLWINYSSIENWRTPIDLMFNLPSNHNTVEKAAHLFFDKTYNNLLSEKLFLKEKYLPIIDFKKLDLDKVQVSDIKCFLEKLGVMTYPPFKEISISDVRFKALFNSKYLISKLSQREDNPRNPRINMLNYNYIEDLENILVSLNNEEVLNWFMNDPKINEELNLKHPGRISFSYSAVIQTYRNFSYEDYTHNYIKFIFQNTKWLEIDNKKYAPKQCVFSYTGIDISKCIPTITTKMIKKLSKIINITQNEVKEFLKVVGVRDSLIELESNEFYELLLNLHDIDRLGQISEKIYRELIDYNGEISHDSTNYKNFMKEGYVFTENHDGKCYHLASDSYFSSSIQVNVGNYHIMRTPVRNGSFELFHKVFGVKQFEEKYSVEKDSIIIHRQNHEFQRNFKDFIKYAHAWSEKNNNIKKRIGSIILNIVSQIDLLDNKNKYSFNSNYRLISDKNNLNNWYIYVSDKLDLNYRLISNCIEELFARIANTGNSQIPNQLGELFRDRDGRKYLVKKHFNTIDAINQVYKNQIKNSFTGALKVPYDSKDIEKIDFEKFTSINNSEAIISVLKSYNKDIEDIKNDGFEYWEQINLKPYYQKQLSNYKIQQEKKYICLTFENYKNKDIEFKKTFYSKIQSYKNSIFNDNEIINSIYFDYKEFMINKYSSLNKNIEIWDVDKVYDDNFRKIAKEYNLLEFGDYIDETPELKSLIYFLNDEICQLIKYSYEKTLNKEVVSNEENIDAIESKKFSIVKSKIAARTTREDKNQKSSKHHTNTKSSILRSNNTKDRKGKEAEKFARDKLMDIYPNLKWTSENSDIPSQRNTSTSYDMLYEKNGVRHYIEIKAATHSFFMTMSEYKFAKNNANVYELYLVDLDKELLDGPHAISDFESSKVPTEFKFSFQKN